MIAEAPKPARKLALRVSGARIGDPVRPTPSGPPAAGTLGSPARAPRPGLRIHARGTTPPPLAASRTSRASDGGTPDVPSDDAYPWEGQP